MNKISKLKMISKEFVSLSDFIKELGRKKDHERVFRGQANCEWSLLPSIARSNVKQKKEKKAFEEFQRIGNRFLSSKDCMETLVLAQHYRLKTRLLDWTTNPLVAIWFACKPQEKKDGAIYVYYPKKSDENNVTDPFEIKQPSLYYPKMDNPRIIAQNGCLTLHPYYEGEGFIPFENDEKINPKIIRFTIAHKKKKELRNELNALGINEMILFPELENLCRYLNWTHLSKSKSRKTIL
jgi:hypothetical protein